ncbi:MAG TPA: alpha/beta hydrolase [Rhabdochlamydiaceae bacterium]|nr:alpha/beta hydrolase [Rhabdochlamydiaceae bacterium]
MKKSEEDVIKIKVCNVELSGNLKIPEGSKGIVVFAHGSGSGRLSPRNRYVAKVLKEKNLATLLFDLLTPHEEETERYTAHLRFDIEMLAERLAAVTDWVKSNPEVQDLNVGYFGASTGAAAALVAASTKIKEIKAVVSRGGRPDLAALALASVKAPTLLIVGGDDYPVIEMNQEAQAKMTCVNKLVIIPGATHLFEEPGTLEQVAELAGQWFQKYLA